MKLKDVCDRSKLCEGRNSGIGFGFCRKVDHETYETVMPISACKDFLNDVIYSEHTGKDHSIYGLYTKKLGLWDCGVAYVAMGILPVNRTTTNRSGHEFLEQGLMSPELGLQSFLSHFETKLALAHCQFDKVAENRMVCAIPLEWCQFPYTISLWSLLVRAGLKYRNEMGDPDIFLSKVADDDASYVRTAIPKIEYLKNNPGSWPKQEFKNQACHNDGIVGFHFPKSPS